MKLVGFSAGSKNGNCEVFVKAALMAAEEKGIEVELIRLNEFELSECTACRPFCPEDITMCPHKDDQTFLIDKFLDSDGYIVAAPVYSLTASSLLFAFRDRVFGPKMDVAKSWLDGKPEPPFSNGRFKARPGGLISVGGALTENWTCLGIPSLYTTTFSAQTDVVDWMNVYGVAEPTACLVEEEYMAHARRIGENVADAMLTGDHRWRGKEGGACPQCHQNLLEIVPDTDKVMCPVCGIYGHITAGEGKSSIIWPDNIEYRRDNRLTPEGKLVHANEVGECRKIFAPKKELAKEMMQKYLDYDCIKSVSPTREAKKAALREQFAKKDEA